MTIAVHRASSSPASSPRLVNPFDSDDESTAPAPPASKIAPRIGRREHSNPFRHRAPHAFYREAGNPFDAGELQSSKKSENSEADKPILSENPHSRYAARKPTGLNPFDDDDHDEPALEEQRDSGKIQQSKIRASPATSSFGGSAMKVARKLKETGANQAEKLKQGGAYHAQKVKETTSKAFKSRDGNIGRELETPKHDYGENRDLLLETNGDRHFHRAVRPGYGDDFLQAGGLESKSVQELESYAVVKSEETTSRINNCLKVAERIKEDGSTTLINLHQQGEQIRRTHEVAVEIDHDLSAGEKLLGSLGGMFSRTWKPKKTRAIKGPMIQDDPAIRRVKHLEQRFALGLGGNNHAKRVPSNYVSSESQSHQMTTESKLEYEKTKQDEALSDLSNVLGQLKEMSLDMGKEISRQNEALGHFQDDIVELGERVKGANVRGRRLLGR